MSLAAVVAVAAGLRERVYYFVSVFLVFILQVIRDVQLLALTFLEGGINVGYLQALLREVLAENVKENRKEVPGSSVLKDKDHASSEEHWVSAIRGLCRAIVKRDIELVSRYVYWYHKASGIPNIRTRFPAGHSKPLRRWQKLDTTVNGAPCTPPFYPEASRSSSSCSSSQGSISP